MKEETELRRVFPKTFEYLIFSAIKVRLLFHNGFKSWREREHFGAIVNHSYGEQDLEIPLFRIHKQCHGCQILPSLGYIIIWVCSMHS